MKNFYGFWNPASNRYPSFEEEYQVGAFLVTASGVFNNEKFRKGEWLVGIREINKLTWATASSFVSVPPSVNLNTPNAGFYTKIRLNNSGQIVDATTLEAKDLPKHSHTAEEVEDFKPILLKVIKNIFTEGMDSAVTFSVDEDTGNITADVDIDENFIIKDNNGRLTVDVDKLNSSLSSPSTDFTEVKKLVENQITEKLKTITVGDQLVFNSEGLEDKTDPNTGIRTIKIKVDTSTITLNANRELTIAPDLLVKLSNKESITGENDYGHKCSNPPTLKELKNIKGFKEWLLEQIASVFDFNIEDYIDNETIILDENGKISAVAMKVQPHTHKIKDIEGLEERLTPAAHQKVNQGQDPNLDWKEGVVDLSDSSIGVAIYYLNQKIKENQNQIEVLQRLIGKAQPAEPEHFVHLISKVQSTLPEIECYDLEQNKKIVKCQQGNLSLIFTKVYPYNSGFLLVSINGQEKIFDLSQFQTVNASVENLTLTYLEDFYKDLAQFTGWYTSGIFSLDLTLSEGEYTIQTVWKDKDQNIKSSQQTKIQYVEVTENPKLDISFITPPLDKKVSGIPCCTSLEAVGEVVWKEAFTQRYIPSVRKVFLKTETEKEELKPQMYSGKTVLFESVSLKYHPDFEGKKTLNFMYSLEKGSFTKEYTLPLFRFDKPDFEKKYRVLWNPDLDNSDPKSLQWQNWNSETNLNDLPELPLIRGVAKNTFEDYRPFGGFDYSKKSNEIQYIELLIPLTKILLKLSHLESLFEQETETFLPQNPLNGLFESCEVLIGLVSNRNVLAVINGNEHYSYEELKVNTRKFKSLDGFHSTAKLRTFTLGNQNQLENIDHVLLRIGIPGKLSLNISKLIESFKGV